MFWTLVSLLVVFGIVRAIWYGIARFWAWLGNGKRLQSAVDDGRVDEDVQRTVAAINHQQALKELRKTAEDNARVALEGHPETARTNSRLSRDQLAQVSAAFHRERELFLDNLALSWYHVVMIFLIASVLGLVIEEVWMFITAGITQSRVGLVWGPFSPIYGLGALLLTLICFELRKRRAPSWVIFVISLCVGGVLEQFAGWTMETLFNAVSWDYTGVPGAITKWVAAPFLVFWGLLGVIWAKLIMPELLFRIGAPTTVRQAVFVGLLTVYLASDIFMTFACFNRESEREQGLPPETAFEQWVDEYYTDEFIANRFQNLVLNG